MSPTAVVTEEIVDFCLTRGGTLLDELTAMRTELWAGIRICAQVQVLFVKSLGKRSSSASARRIL